MKNNPAIKQAIEKGLIVGSVGVNIAALTAAVSGGAGVALTAIPEGLDEATWQNIVVGFATAHGWVAAHCQKRLVKRGKKQWWETTMPSGWFDLVLARDSNRTHRDSVYFVELKIPPNVQTPEQKRWEKLMTACGQTCFLWYPEHWGVIQKLLSRPVEE